VQARATYERGRDAGVLSLASLEARSRALGAARLVVVVVACALIGGIVWARLGPWSWATFGGLVIAFIVLVFVHARVHDDAQRASADLRFHKRGLARLRHAWDELPAASDRFAAADHPFASDLDVFGRASLMQLIDATETRFGETRLAQLLSLVSPASFPQEALARQEAVRDLAKRFAFREALATTGVRLEDEKPDPATLVVWAEGPHKSPSIIGWVAWIVPAVILGAIALGAIVGISASVVTALSIGGIAVGIAAGARFAPMLEAVSAGASSVTRWGAMIAAIEGERFDATLLCQLRAKLESDGRRASHEIGRLERIVSFSDARRNEVFRFIIGPLLMWDAHCAIALLRWRARTGSRLRAWLETLGEIEALASLAGFAFEHPDFAWPDLSSEPGFEARDLGHPLIDDDRRVGNDVRFASSGHALVITGSNMSGKSTLLRALGTNAVLAAAGAPTCAKAFRMGPLRVATSMSIEDSLEQGVSHFYAELHRLKRVIDLAREPGSAPVLFLLDEILHGTNSRERIIGACAVVEELLTLGALGAVSTHDLGITVLERKLAGRVENAHFEEQVHGDAMTFDYVLRPGIVRSSNALRLMRAVGIDVKEDAECP
jgi:ABC-type multidrug transport system fused ATPase/permease subunit